MQSLLAGQCLQSTACADNRRHKADRCRWRTRGVAVCTVSPAEAGTVQAGTGFFQGVQHDATALGSTFVDIFHKLFDIVVPVLYPRLEIGVLPLKGDEPEKLITAANLNGLPPVFYHDKSEQSLVVKQSGKFLPNLGADLCREILDYLKKEHALVREVVLG